VPQPSSLLTPDSSRKAVALYSGGLDSTLAIIAVLRQGVGVTAVTFLNHFGCDISDKSSCSKDPFSAAGKFGFEVKLSHLSEKFIDTVKNPKFGHGRNMNPCMDCRILMLKEAKAFMEMTGASFIITGEVLGQRPMSQRRDALNIIDREAGLRGMVLRPLSAKLLKPMSAEEAGLINRELLYDFSGRSRKPQMALAKEFGLTEYPAPAGGCLLTEPNYSYRLKELFDYAPNPSLLDLRLLRIGRHFRLSPECKAVVGRDMSENEDLSKLTDEKGIFLRVIGHGSPIVLVRGTAGRDEVTTAASLCARYSDARKLAEADVKVIAGKEVTMLKVVPAPDVIIEALKIEKRSHGKSLLRRETVERAG
jgi:tRNA-specific 2-thiouridylase